jgi:septum formation protein
MPKIELPGGVRLILASASPRRRNLLEAAGIPFVLRPANVDETRRWGESARDYVVRLASDKARGVEAGPDEMVLGADTTVVGGSEILEKPRDAGDAARMLEMLSGGWHEVITGIALAHRGEIRTAAETTRVHFVLIPRAEIDDYIATGEPMDKAGAYGIQGMASRWADRIEGCYFNIVGLPVARVWEQINGLLAGRQV